MTTRDRDIERIARELCCGEGGCVRSGDCVALGKAEGFQGRRYNKSPQAARIYDLTRAAVLKEVGEKANTLLMPRPTTATVGLLQEKYIGWNAALDAVAAKLKGEK